METHNELVEIECDMEVLETHSPEFAQCNTLWRVSRKLSKVVDDEMGRWEC
jgi:hypothetical protein